MQGFDNEYNFVLALNNKRICELNPILQDLIHTIFNNIEDDVFIKAWCNHYKQKSDILIKIGSAIKGVSIKLGSRNSVHVEHIKEFLSFLKEHNVPDRIINNYLLFHYADGTNNNTGLNRINTESYKYNHQNELDEINRCFMNKIIIMDAINRFVLKGNNSEYEISAIILGRPNDFIWLKKEDIVNTLLLDINSYCTSPHFSNLVCQPMNRCINRNSKYEKYRDYVQIKWYSLFDDIIKQMNNGIK